jgi:hypothetical protein
MESRMKSGSHTGSRSAESQDYAIVPHQDLEVKTPAAFVADVIEVVDGDITLTDGIDDIEDDVLDVVNRSSLISPYRRILRNNTDSKPDGKMSYADRLIEDIIQQNANALHTFKLQEASLSSGLSATSSSSTYFSNQRQLQLQEKPSRGPRNKKKHGSQQLKPMKSASVDLLRGDAQLQLRYANNNRNSKIGDLKPTVEHIVIPN